jgi:hypothetical protein
LFGGVDILFVVDRSARMGSAQAKLARAMPDLVAAIDELPAGASARVAFTKAEAPVPPCPGVAPAELTLRSCREHLDDFVRDDGTEARASACTDVCMLDSIPPTDGAWLSWSIERARSAARRDRSRHHIGAKRLHACACEERSSSCNAALLSSSSRRSPSLAAVAAAPRRNPPGRPRPTPHR